MNKIILSIFALAISMATYAQSDRKQGEVSYEEIIQLKFNRENLPPEMRDRIPKERKVKKVLYFNSESSSYQASKEQVDGPVPGEGRGRGMRFMMSSPDNKVYLNFTDNLQIEQREFMSRIFLIKGEPTQNKWKLTPKQKMILDYPCLQAEQIREKDTIVAWFAPSIPVSAGPGNYVNLPGLVLAVDINHGSRTIMAKSVELKPIAEELIAKPKKGKNVTEDEFRKIVMEKRKEMGAENRGGHMMIMHGGHR